MAGGVPAAPPCIGCCCWAKSEPTAATEAAAAAIYMVFIRMDNSFIVKPAGCSGQRIFSFPAHLVVAAGAVAGG